ncbi:hypothetical protein [Roseateles paludis]|jgi:hypothetical protein|uniref:Uncharacterized protein n=1 Tax=Roseateles paludis TaxID=3145238 RepID=A0ABV0G756_9BURK
MKSVLLAALLATALPAFAQAEAQALSACVGAKSTGQDRKDLAKWLFTAMAAHPDMKPLSTVSDPVAEASSKTAGELFTRLLSDACATEAKAALKAGGPMAIQVGFQTLGQLAMQELMTDKDVAASMGRLDKYLDRQKLATLGQ